jgi:hypothetical protein
LLIIGNAMVDLWRTANHKFIHQNNKAKHLEICNSSFGTEAHRTHTSRTPRPDLAQGTCVYVVVQICVKS